MSHLPRDLMLRLRDEYKLSTFVETGTHLGDTAAMAAPHFDHVYTIEVRKTLFDAARSRLRAWPNVFCFHGDSAEVLRQQASRVAAPLFWLDGHYSGPGTGMASTECPLLGELEAIKSLPLFAAVIDDARMFFKQRIDGHNIDHWPSVDEIRQAIGDRFMQQIGDLFVVTPGEFHV